MRSFIKKEPMSIWKRDIKGRLKNSIKHLIDMETLFEMWGCYHMSKEEKLELEDYLEYLKLKAIKTIRGLK